MGQIETHFSVAESLTDFSFLLRLLLFFAPFCVVSVRFFFFELALLVRLRPLCFRYAFLLFRFAKVGHALIASRRGLNSQPNLCLPSTRRCVETAVDAS